MPPEALVARLEASGLRGRGGGWFPAARKWRAVRAEGGAPLVVANGAEGEPGSVKDRHLLRTRAADILAGLALAARAVGALEAVVFLKKAFGREAETVRAALAAAPPPGLTVRVAHGDDSYIVGEETALLESLEGRRPWPRPKPPLPAAVGFLGRPTLVHNVETLARLPAALADPEGYRANETTFVSLWGDVRRPGLYEVRLGMSLGALIDALGGGCASPSGQVACVFPGGPSSSPLGAARLDTALDPDALRAAGSSLGTGALLVVSSERRPFDLAVSLAAFFERESCGQCPPCVRGTESLHKVARALRAGTARARDVSDVPEITGFMGMHGYCAHCRAAASSVSALLATFRDAVASAVEGLGAAGSPAQVPAPSSAASSPLAYDPFAPGSAQRTAIEAVLA